MKTILLLLSGLFLSGMLRAGGPGESILVLLFIIIGGAFVLRIRSSRFIAAGLCLIITGSSAFADWTQRVTVPLVVQVNAPPCWYGCGAATASMCLMSTPIKGNVTVQPTLAQLRTDTENNRIEPGFFTPPDAEQFVLNKYTDKIANPWILDRQAQNANAGAALAYAFSSYGTPAATLVYKGGHWVAVTGIGTDVQPNGANNFKIKWFEINDPWARGRHYQHINYAIWIAAYQTTCRVWNNPAGCANFPLGPGNSPNNNVSVGNLNSVIYDPLGVVNNFGILPDAPVRPQPGTMLNSVQAAAVAVAAVEADPEGFGDLQGKSATFAELVSVNPTGDVAWNIGFADDTQQVYGDVIIDAYRGDLIEADWGDSTDFFSWQNRAQYFPYLADRISDAGGTSDPVATATTDFFYVTPANVGVPVVSWWSRGLLTASLLGMGLFVLRRRQKKYGMA